MKQKKYKHRDTNNQAWTRISQISGYLRENKNKDTNNPMDDEFGFNYNVSEDDYNKLRAKEQKKSMPQPIKKRKKKNVWVKISDGLYENQTKRKKKKEKINHFRGLGSSSRGPI